jgi:NADH-quinone oxidoreductase subunit L
MALSVTLIVIMIIWAYMHTKRKTDFAENTGIAKVLEEKWYVDELYDAVIVKPLQSLSAFMNKYIERGGIDATVNNVGRLVNWGSSRMRLLQSGQVGTYIFAMVIGVVVLFAIGLLMVG